MVFAMLLHLTGTDTQPSTMTTRQCHLQNLPPGMITAHTKTCTAKLVQLQNYCTMMAKTTPYSPRHRDRFLPKEPGPVAGYTRRVTLTNHTAGPLATIQT